MTKRIALLAVSASLLVPSVSSAQSVEFLQSQVEALLRQIASLQLQVAQPIAVKPSPNASLPSPGPSACPTLYRSLLRGARGEDVRSLQTFLIAQQFLSSDSVTGFFGAQTEAALMRWQSQSGVVSSGDATTTGWGVLGARTRAAIASRCKPSDEPLTATPVSGIAPLTVTFTSVYGDGSGTRPSFVDGRDTVIDFGDGAEPLWVQCVGSDGYCAVPVRIQHTYLSNGTYSVTLKKTGGKCAMSCTDTILGRASVQVGAPNIQPACTLRATPSVPEPGRAVLLSWTSQKATRASLGIPSSGEVLEVPLNGSRTVVAPSTGSATYELRVTSATGAQARCTGTVTVTPVSVGSTSFNASPAVGPAPLSVLFNGTVQSAGYSVDFGDGTTSGTIGCEHGGCPTASAPTTVNISHVYGNAGTYVAKLKRNATIAEAKCTDIDCNVVSSIIVSVSGPVSSVLPNMTASIPQIVDFVDRGVTVPISWNASNVPTGSSVYLALVRADGISGGGIIADRLQTSGTFSWRIPSADDRALIGGDYYLHGVNITNNLAYRIHVILYIPTTAQCFEGCPPSMGTHVLTQVAGSLTIGRP